MLSLINIASWLNQISNIDPENFQQSMQLIILEDFLLDFFGKLQFQYQRVKGHYGVKSDWLPETTWPAIGRSHMVSGSQSDFTP